MQWVAPSEKDAATGTLEKRLWDSADPFRANSGLKAQEGILYLAPNARFDFLLNLPKAADIGAKVNDAMRDVEKHKPQARFGEAVRPMRRAAITLAAQIQNLRWTRDLLLPRLLSGQVNPTES